MHIAIPESASYILNTLHRAGYEAYLVGGCVRDALLGKTPEDWDITTNARPQQVKALFCHTVDTGLQHGTVTVMLRHVGYEVTTYRIDGSYERHRRPKEVAFTTSLKEDMLRRDFTINAMAYNEEEGLIDHFGGQADLQSGVLRCVGDAMHRFDEDALRVLRALRFAAQLDFSIAPDTLTAMQEKAEFLRDVSAERIRVELTKLLVSGHPERLAQIGYSCGITAIVLPEFDEMYRTEQENPHHCYNVGVHCLKAASYIEPTPLLRWAALLHDIGKPATKTVDSDGIAHFYRHGAVGAEKAAQVLQRLKFDNDTIHRVRQLVYWHDYNWGREITPKKVRRAAAKIGPEYMQDLWKLQRADVMAQSAYAKDEKLALLDAIQICYEQICKERQCLTLRELAVDGRDLMELGMSPGKAMGQMLHWLLEQVVDAPEKNDRDILVNLAQQRMKMESHAPDNREIQTEQQN